MMNRKNEDRVDDDFQKCKKKQNSRFNEKGLINKRKYKNIKKIVRPREFNEILLNKKKNECF
jgi:hypothetical protein